MQHDLMPTDACNAKSRVCFCWPWHWWRVVGAHLARRHRKTRRARILTCHGIGHALSPCSWRVVLDAFGFASPPPGFSSFRLPPLPLSPPCFLLPLLSGEHKTRVSWSSGLPTLFDERVLDVDGPVVVGCLQRELASDLRLGRAILWAAP